MRAVAQTVHECRDLWADPPAWQAQLMRRVCQLSGSRIGLYLEKADHAGMTADRVLAAHDVGWESAGERRTVVDALANRPLRYSPLWANFADLMADRRRAAGSPAAGSLTARQDRFIDTPAWQSSEMYDRHVRPTRLGRVVLSAVWMPHLSAWTVWSLVTDRGDPAQSTRQARLVRLLHRQVAPLVGTALSTWRDRNLAALSDTRRGVLEALLDGQSEPGIARQSCRSHAAVHEHVTALYRHFDVNSRGELAAFFLRRRPVPLGRPPTAYSPSGWLNRPWTEPHLDRAAPPPD